MLDASSYFKRITGSENYARQLFYVRLAVVPDNQALPHVLVLQVKPVAILLDPVESGSDDRGVCV